LGLAPNTVRKYLRQDGPPKRRATPRAKLLDRYVSHIDELIRSTPKITAVRVGSYLRQFMYTKWVIVVDDDIDFRDSMAHALNEQGWQMVQCSDASSANAILRQEVVDVLVLDLRMETATSGWEVLDFVQLHPMLLVQRAF